MELRSTWRRCLDSADGQVWNGEPGRNRTCDPRIKSALLYQLSYGPTLNNLTWKPNEDYPRRTYETARYAGRSYLSGVRHPLHWTGPERQDQSAELASDAWLKFVDSGDYSQSWAEASSMFKAAVTEKDWEQKLKAARGPLGALFSRKLISAEYKTTLPGAPDGQYVVIRYDSSFANKKSAVETVTPMLDKDGQRRVSGYLSAEYMSFRGAKVFAQGRHYGPGCRIKQKPIHLRDFLQVSSNRPFQRKLRLLQRQKDRRNTLALSGFTLMPFAVHSQTARYCALGIENAISGSGREDIR